MITQPVLQQITDLIVRIASPEKVFLFGSRANGTATTESDFDFMIVVRDDVQNLRALPTLERTIFETGRRLYAHPQPRE